MEEKEKGDVEVNIIQFRYPSVASLFGKGCLIIDPVLVKIMLDIGSNPSVVFSQPFCSETFQNIHSPP